MAVGGDCVHIKTGAPVTHIDGEPTKGLRIHVDTAVTSVFRGIDHGFPGCEDTRLVGVVKRNVFAHRHRRNPHTKCVFYLAGCPLQCGKHRHIGHGVK